MTQPRLWRDEVIDALSDLGGQADLKDIYAQVEKRGVMNFKANRNWSANSRHT